jgi:leucyl/phenylalanyl-tRNA---protein transferase
MPVFWLKPHDISFPNPALANRHGILAIGGDLSPERLLHAYTIGLFPWFNPGEPIAWWCPDPRCVLFPDELIVHKSMRPYFNQQKFKVTFDEDFGGVMRNCKSTREGNTWLSEEMIAAYTTLHRLGYAHSVEVWQEEKLVGGLYGVVIGKVFFGESMFAHVSNASKVGFITLVNFLKTQDFTLIDCQQATEHLQSMGARTIPRADFLYILSHNQQFPTHLWD